MSTISCYFLTKDEFTVFLLNQFFKFSALYSSFSNFNNIFINNSPITSQDKKHLYTKNYNVLDKLDTFIYQFLYNKNYIRIKSFNIPLYNVIDLDISNIVYILICKKCNMFYIGQSGRKFKISLVFDWYV